MRLALLVASSLLAAACVGEEEAGPPIPVTGSWRRLQPDEFDRQEILTFRADGTLTSSTRGEGTYNLDGGALTTDVGSVVRTQDYARDGSGALLLQALYPVGEVDQFEGTWRGSTRTGDVTEHWTLILDGGVATIEHRGADDPYTIDGSWTNDGNLIFFFPPGVFREIIFRGLPGRVIGMDPYVLF